MFAAPGNSQVVAAERREVGRMSTAERRAQQDCQKAGLDSDLPCPSSATTLALRCSGSYQLSMDSCPAP